LINLLVFIPKISLAKKGVVINEIAWMGTKNSSHHEWIELYNASPLKQNLKNWQLLSEDGSPKITLKGEILPFGFFILERGNDKTIPEIPADLIYKGALNNKGEHLKLIDSQGNIIDEVDCSWGWFAGDNKTKRTMERKNPFLSGSISTNWQTSKNPGGTPKSKNSFGFQEKPKKKNNFKKIPSKANISVSVEKKKINQNLSIFCIGVAVALISGIIVFFLKKKFYQQNEQDIEMTEEEIDFQKFFK